MKQTNLIPKIHFIKTIQNSIFFISGQFTFWQNYALDYNRWLYIIVPRITKYNLLLCNKSELFDLSVGIVFFMVIYLNKNEHYNNLPTSILSNII